jgi:hypothetical protein
MYKVLNKPTPSDLSSPAFHTSSIAIHLLELNKEGEVIFTEFNDDVPLDTVFPHTCAEKEFILTDVLDKAPRASNL